MTKWLPLLALAASPAVCQQTEDKVYKISRDMTPPRVLQKVDPGYGEDARNAKIQGAVLLSLVVGSDGVARDIKVVRSLYPGLDDKAIASVQQWKFQPAAKDGEAVGCYATVEVNFRLLEKPKN